MFHKIEELGFAAVYKEKELVHRALRRFFFLPYVPIEHVVSAFEFCAAELSRFFDFFFCVNSRLFSTCGAEISSV